MRIDVNLEEEDMMLYFCYHPLFHHVNIWLLLFFMGKMEFTWKTSLHPFFQTNEKNGVDDDAQVECLVAQGRTNDDSSYPVTRANVDPRKLLNVITLLGKDTYKKLYPKRGG